MSSTALVTGGNGFIGAWIARRLMARGIAVRVLDLDVNPARARAIIGALADGVEWRSGDVSDGRAVREAARGCGLLVHLAAVLTPACQADPIRGAHINLLGTLNVFEAARAEGIERVIYMSSAGVFGPDDGVHPRPTTHYGAFKLAGEGCARAYHADHGIASAGFRPLVVYGPGREVGLTAGPTLACRAAARGEPYTIPFSGESDFVFVDDVAAAFEAAATAELRGAEVYNVVGVRAPVADLARRIETVVPGARIDCAGPKVPVCAAIEPGRLREVFSGVPLTGLDEGLRRTVDFYAER
ncbi:MAG: SDR family oxidoreductase [Ectothiorhodospiraceae bacterium]|nr:SDR family oxidoreductase [Ectothiorhodospiraceae bacterium]